VSQTATGATALKEPSDAALAQTSTHARRRTAGRHRVTQSRMHPTAHRSQAPVPLQGGTRPTPATHQRRQAPPPPHPCSRPDSRRAPMPHLRTPHAGTARSHPSSYAPSMSLETRFSALWLTCARDSGNKIAASAHGMGSGCLAVDAMVIGCLGVERHVERVFILSHFWANHFLTASNRTKRT
jgi:hypothetical protein